MSFINYYSITFTGREMKAIAKFCGLRGTIFITKDAMYAFDGKRSSAMRIKYHETYVVTNNPCDTDPDKPRVETVRVDAFDGFESVYMIQYVQPFAKLKVGDTTSFSLTTNISYDGGKGTGLYILNPTWNILDEAVATIESTDNVFVT